MNNHDEHPPTVQISAESASVMSSSLTTEDPFLRGSTKSKEFAITVSEPTDAPVLYHQRPSRAGSALLDVALRDPDGVALERTESRLPSLSDMMADELLTNEVLLGENVSEEHKALQNVLLRQGNNNVYEGLMELVRKSYTCEEFRINVVADEKLLDSLVLFVKQRCTSLALLLQHGLDAYGAPSSAANPELPHMALLIGALKLFRNLLPVSEEVALYMHHHRLADVLLLQADAFVYVEELMIQPKTEIEPWCKQALANQSSGRVLLQVLTNLVSRAPSLCHHLLPLVFPTAIPCLSCITNDADLLCCFLTILMTIPSTHKLLETSITDRRGGHAWYALLSRCFLYFKNEEKSQHKANNEWISRFFALLCSKRTEEISLFVQVLHAIQEIDATLLDNLIPVSPNDSPRRSGSHSFTRRGSRETFKLPLSDSRNLATRLFQAQPADLAVLLLQIVAAVAEGEAAVASSELQSLSDGLLNAKQFRELLQLRMGVARDFVASFAAESPNRTDRRRASKVQLSKFQGSRSFLEIQKLAVALTASLAMASSDIRKECWSSFGEELFDLSLQIIAKFAALTHGDLREVLQVVDRRRAILLVANLALNFAPAATLAAENEAAVAGILCCGGLSEEEVGLEEVAAYATKCLSSSKIPAIHDLLTKLLRDRFKDFHPPEHPRTCADHAQLC